MPRRAATSSHRLTWADLAELASDVGPGPRVVGASVHLAHPVSVAQVLARVAARVDADPVLALALDRVLVRPPKRWPRWEHPALRPSRQCGVLAVPVGDSVDAVVERAITRPLPADRPLWRLDLLTEAGGTHTSDLLFRAHHALLDGPTAVVALARLLADDPDLAIAPAPVAAGPAHQSSPRALPGLGAAASWSRRSPRTRLLRPIGTQVRLITVTTDLERLSRAAHLAGATVNDALLAVVGRTVLSLTSDLGEHLPYVTVSVPVTRGGDGRRRNSIGLLRLPVPAPLPGESSTGHLRRIARRTRWRKRLLGDDSAARLAAPGLAVAGITGLMAPYLRRQRTITTLLTNLRGPQRLQVLGAEVDRIVPITPSVGNLPVIAVALSHAGTLGLTFRVDPKLVSPDQVRLAAEAALAVVLGD